MKLRQNIRELEILENKAAQISGMYFLLLDERRLFAKDNAKYIKGYINELLINIGPEVLAAAKLGKELGEEIS